MISGFVRSINWHNEHSVTQPCVVEQMNEPCTFSIPPNKSDIHLKSTNQEKKSARPFQGTDYPPSAVCWRGKRCNCGTACPEQAVLKTEWGEHKWWLLWRSDRKMGDTASNICWPTASTFSALWQSTKRQAHTWHLGWCFPAATRETK